MVRAWLTAYAPFITFSLFCRKLGFSRRIRWKREARRLLTEEEYQKQAEEETQKALEELRKYCNSPDISPWKTVSRIQSPKRFEGGKNADFHLTCTRWKRLNIDHCRLFRSSWRPKHLAAYRARRSIYLSQNYLNSVPLEGLLNVLRWR